MHKVEGKSVTSSRSVACQAAVDNEIRVAGCGVNADHLLRVASPLDVHATAGDPVDIPGD